MNIKSLRIFLLYCFFSGIIFLAQAESALRVNTRARAQSEEEMPKSAAPATNIIPASQAPAETQTQPAEETVAETTAETAQETTTAQPEPAGIENRNTPEVIDKASESNPLRKAARGAVNATLGWVEIPRQIIKENKGKKDIKSVLWGPVKGFSYFVSRTAVGIYEITTFLIPPYKPVVDPEFIFPEDEK